MFRYIIVIGNFKDIHNNKMKLGAKLMYKEEEKIIVRKKIFSKAVNILAKDRKDSTITTLDYFDAVESFMLNDSWHPDDAFLASMLNDSVKDSWKNHFNSILGEKKPNELRVAYLSGPNPENDLIELIKLGILPENIWAFESKNAIYEEAVENLQFMFPQVKIHRGKISSFFENSAIKFDIVYLDFCGTFFSSNKNNKNISTLVSLLDNHRLSSPGALITNYAFIDDNNDPKFKTLIAKIVSLYLYPKAYADKGCSAEEQGLLFHEWHRKVEKNLDYYYSEFIRRFMMDLTSVIIPFMRIAKSKEYFEIFFKVEKHEIEICKRNLFEYRDDLEEVDLKSGIEDDFGGHLASEMWLFSIPWFLDMAQIKDIECLYNLGYKDETEREELKLFYESFYDKAFYQATQNIIRQISYNKAELLDKFNVMLYLIFVSSPGVCCYSDKLLNVYNTDFRQIAPQACDVFTFHSIVGLLLGQLSVPYHINVQKSSGWVYKAKETNMYTDLFVLDECRYIYDMMPTIDMITNRIENMAPQVCYRFALDALDKNHIRYNPELFYGNAVIGVNHNGFEERLFGDRHKIESSAKTT